MAQYDFITNETPTLNQIREFGWILCIRDLYRKHNSLTKNVDVLTTMEEGQSTDGLLSPESILLITDYGLKLKNLGTYTHIYHSGNTSGHTQTWYADANNVYLQYFCTAPTSGNTTEHNHSHNQAPMPVASATLAGIITANDYKKLNTITEIPTVADRGYLITYLTSVVINAEEFFTAEGGDLILKSPFLIDPSMDIYSLMLNDNCSHINFFLNNDILTFEMIDENTFGITYNNISYVCDSCGSASPTTGIVFHFTVSG